MPTKPAQKATQILVAEFSFDHDTKGSIQYKQEAEPNGKRPAIGTLYLTKEFLATVKGPETKHLRVTVEALG